MAATNRGKKFRSQLAAATCAVLGTASAAGATNFDGWDYDTSILYYHESGGRVTAVEPVGSIRRALSENRSFTLRATLDALTGATPSGASTTNRPQTFTRPSGKHSYVVQPGEVPLDDTFHDTRIALNGSWQQPLGRLSLMTLGANLSKEYDFLSMGANALFSRDFFDRNTTVTWGLSSEFDRINPVGDVPISFATVAPAETPQPRRATSDTKQVLDTTLGLTQVINAKTIAEVNYSLSHSDGYLNDPYKLLSVIDPATGDTTRNIYENRPDRRTKHAFFGLVRRHLGRDTVSASYRYFLDDWGIHSHTMDLNYHWALPARWWLEPNVRLYHQSEANFYHVFLPGGFALPSYASADYRLAQFNALTLGLKYGFKLTDEKTVTFKVEYYRSYGHHGPDAAVGVQQGLTFYPDLKATIVQIQYGF